MIIDMKFKILLILIIHIALLLGCKPHVYYKGKKPRNIGDSYLQKIDLNGFEAYYCAVFHSDTNLIKPFSENDSDRTRHLTDLRYILINRKINRFIMISNMPIRYQTATKKRIPYYMDSLMYDYQSSINIYGVNNFVYGIIDSGYLIFRFNEKRKDQYVKFEIDNSSNILKLTEITYPNKVRENCSDVQLDDVLQKEALLFKKMDSFQFILRNSNQKKCKNSHEIYLKKEIKFYALHRKIIGTNTKKIRKRITFEVNDTSFYSFVEKGHRFSFVLPPVIECGQ